MKANGTGYFSWERRFTGELSRDLDSWAARMYAQAHGLPLPKEREEVEETVAMPPTYQTAEGSLAWAF